ncbi:nestin isoform X2 [Engystomops pustulosus]|uniref:nestin isoform X2 n=1 Tax=Engystomops pustulosus TaxID=76066 RepID=UPI003AFB3CB1
MSRYAHFYKYFLEVETLEKEKQDLRAQIAQVLEDRQQLMHLKMSLSLEVATYRSLLEAENTRVYSPVADYKISFHDAALEQSTFRKSRHENTKSLVSRDNRLNSNKKQSVETPRTNRYLNVKSTSFSNRASPVTKEFQKVSSVLQSQSLNYTKATSAQTSTPLPPLESNLGRRPQNGETFTKSKVEDISKSYTQGASKSITKESTRKETIARPVVNENAQDTGLIKTDTKADAEGELLLSTEKEATWTPVEFSLKADVKQNQVISELELEEQHESVEAQNKDRLVFEKAHQEKIDIEVSRANDDHLVEGFGNVIEKQEIISQIVSCEREYVEKAELVEPQEHQNIETPLKANNEELRKVLDFTKPNTQDLNEPSVPSLNAVPDQDIEYSLDLELDFDTPVSSYVDNSSEAIDEEKEILHLKKEPDSSQETSHYLEAEVNLQEEVVTMDQKAQILGFSKPDNNQLFDDEQNITKNEQKREIEEYNEKTEKDVPEDAINDNSLDQQPPRQDIFEEPHILDIKSHVDQYENTKQEYTPFEQVKQEGLELDVASESVDQEDYKNDHEHDGNIIDVEQNIYDSTHIEQSSIVVVKEVYQHTNHQVLEDLEELQLESQEAKYSLKEITEEFIDTNQEESEEPKNEEIFHSTDNVQKEVVLDSQQPDLDDVMSDDVNVTKEEGQQVDEDYTENEHVVQAQESEEEGDQMLDTQPEVKQEELHDIVQEETMIPDKQEEDIQTLKIEIEQSEGNQLLDMETLISNEEDKNIQKPEEEIEKSDISESVQLTPGEEEVSSAPEHKEEDEEDVIEENYEVCTVVEYTKSIKTEVIPQSVHEESNIIDKVEPTPAGVKDDSFISEDKEEQVSEEDYEISTAEYTKSVKTEVTVHEEYVSHEEDNITEREEPLPPGEKEHSCIQQHETVKEQEQGVCLEHTQEGESLLGDTEPFIERQAEVFADVEQDIVKLDDVQQDSEDDQDSPSYKKTDFVPETEALVQEPEDKDHEESAKVVVTDEEYIASKEDETKQEKGDAIQESQLLKNETNVQLNDVSDIELEEKGCFEVEEGKESYHEEVEVAKEVSYQEVEAQQVDYQIEEKVEEVEEIHKSYDQGINKKQEENVQQDLEGQESYQHDVEEKLEGDHQEVEEKLETDHHEVEETHESYHQEIEEKHEGDHQEVEEKIETDHHEVEETHESYHQEIEEKHEGDHQEVEEKLETDHQEEEETPESYHQEEEEKQDDHQEVEEKLETDQQEEETQESYHQDVEEKQEDDIQEVEEKLVTDRHEIKESQESYHQDVEEKQDGHQEVEEKLETDHHAVEESQASYHQEVEEKQEGDHQEVEEKLETDHHAVEESQASYHQDVEEKQEGDHQEVEEKLETDHHAVEESQESYHQEVEEKQEGDHQEVEEKLETDHHAVEESQESYHQEVEEKQEGDHQEEEEKLETDHHEVEESQASYHQDVEEKQEGDHQEVEEKLETDHHAIEESQESYHQEVEEKQEDDHQKVEEKLETDHHAVEESQASYHQDVEEKQEGDHQEVEEKLETDRHAIEETQESYHQEVEEKQEGDHQEVEVIQESYLQEVEEKQEGDHQEIVEKPETDHHEVEKSQASSHQEIEEKQEDDHQEVEEKLEADNQIEETQESNRNNIEETQNEQQEVEEKLETDCQEVEETQESYPQEEEEKEWDAHQKVEEVEVYHQDIEGQKDYFHEVDGKEGYQQEQEDNKVDDVNISKSNDNVESLVEDKLSQAPHKDSNEDQYMGFTLNMISNNLRFTTENAAEAQPADTKTCEGDIPVYEEEKDQEIVESEIIYQQSTQSLELEHETFNLKDDRPHVAFAETPAEKYDFDQTTEKQLTEFDEMEETSNLNNEYSKSEDSLDSQDISIYSPKSEEFEISKDYQLEQTLPDTTPLPNLDDEFEDLAEDEIISATEHSADVTKSQSPVDGGETEEMLDSSLESQSSQLFPGVIEQSTSIKEEGKDSDNEQQTEILKDLEGNNLEDVVDSKTEDSSAALVTEQPTQTLAESTMVDEYEAPKDSQLEDAQFEISLPDLTTKSEELVEEQDQISSEQLGSENVDEDNNKESEEKKHEKLETLTTLPVEGILSSEHTETDPSPSHEDETENVEDVTKIHSDLIKEDSELAQTEEIYGEEQEEVRQPEEDKTPLTDLDKDFDNLVEEEAILASEYSSNVTKSQSPVDSGETEEELDSSLESQSSQILGEASEHSHIIKDGVKDSEQKAECSEDIPVIEHSEQFVDPTGDTEDSFARLDIEEPSESPKESKNDKCEESTTSQDAICSVKVDESEASEISNLENIQFETSSPDEQEESSNELVSDNLDRDQNKEPEERGTHLVEDTNSENVSIKNLEFVPSSEHVEIESIPEDITENEENISKGQNDLVTQHFELGHEESVDTEGQEKDIHKEEKPSTESLDELNEDDIITSKVSDVLTEESEVPDGITMETSQEDVKIDEKPLEESSETDDSTTSDESSPNVSTISYTLDHEEIKTQSSETSVKTSDISGDISPQELVQDNLVLTPELVPTGGPKEPQISSDEDTDVSDERSDSSLESNKEHEYILENTGGISESGKTVNGIFGHTIVQATLNLDVDMFNGHSTEENREIIISETKTIVTLDSDIVSSQSEVKIEDSVIEFKVLEGKSEGLFQSLLEASEHKEGHLDEASEINTIVQADSASEQSQYSKKLINPYLSEGDLYDTSEISSSVVAEDLIKTKQEVQETKQGVHQDQEDSWSDE